MNHKSFLIGSVSELNDCRDRRVQQFINGEAGERLMELRAGQVGE